MHQQMKNSRAGGEYTLVLEEMEISRLMKRLLIHLRMRRPLSIVVSQRLKLVLDVVLSPYIEAKIKPICVTSAKSEILIPAVTYKGCRLN